MFFFIQLNFFVHQRILKKKSYGFHQKLDIDRMIYERSRDTSNGSWNVKIENISQCCYCIFDRINWTQLAYGISFKNIQKS